MFQDDNCAGHYATKSKAEILIDFSNCKGKTCLLRFYWLTLQEPKWQVYSKRSTSAKVSMPFRR